MITALVLSRLDYIATLYSQAFPSRPSDRYSVHRTPLLVSSLTPSQRTSSLSSDADKIENYLQTMPPDAPQCTETDAHDACRSLLRARCTPEI